MRKIENYSLKNGSVEFTLLSTAGIFFSIALLAWSWYTSLSVLKFNRPSEMCRLLGDDLWALAHYKTNLFGMLLFFQACGYAGLFFTSRILFQRTSLRRRMKALLLAVAAGLTLLDQLIWWTAPFFRFSQTLAGWIGLVSALALILLTLPPLVQMWFYKRWPNPKPSRIVIVGGGFAGVYAALGLDKVLGYHPHLDITVIDRKNFFLFPPLLPSAATGTIEMPQVTQSYRRIFETTNIHYKKATVTGIDPKARSVRMHVHLEGEDIPDPVNSSAGTVAADTQASIVGLPYDYLVLAPGSTNQTFNTPGAEDHAIFVKELIDAIKIRNRIIDCFERAAVVQDETVRRELLRFAVVGGGPTGVEIATEIQDLIHEVLLKRYPEISSEHPEVSIIQSGPQVLPGWPDSVVRRTTQQLGKLGVKLILNNRVVEVRHNAVVLKDGPSIATRSILWCAGVKPSPLMAACGLPLDKSGRVAVDEFLRVPGLENVFVLGDSALCMGADGKPLPALGQVAFQQGDHMAVNLARLLCNEPLKPFKYFNFGALVSVGEHYAAVDLLGIKLTGFIGWFVWRTLYLAKMIGLSTKVRILVDWTLDLFIERSIAVIDEAPHSAADAPNHALEPVRVKLMFIGLTLGLGILNSSRAVQADEISSLMVQADAAYAKREDVTQDKIAMLTYEKVALADSSQAIEADWKASRAAWWLGEHGTARADRLEDYQKGMDDARKAIALNPDCVEAHFWLGANEGSYGDTKGVMKSLGMVKPLRHEMAEVIRINDHYDNGSAYQILGVVDYKVPGFIGGSKTRAKEELQKALVIGPNDPFHHYYMAEYWKITGEKNKLKTELDALNALQPSPDLIPETKMLQERAHRELE